MIGAVSVTPPSFGPSLIPWSGPAAMFQMPIDGNSSRIAASERRGAGWRSAMQPIVKT
jgi:hypothetical protein